ncbi:DUF4159 domain-containing protein [Alsobacter sp. SYSU M60028]|uniref:DUF4159 domain-containing protein n=1 Tax=Alsobacter ponti TaxID=2962936 RepID=A0ABT1L6K2_9HYPH|nr:DUF4159 domain-containing protein [Alsobacter ponti]MCP8936997.1 DUF4159 domain-containing protein [Alsobacter ponti]
MFEALPFGFSAPAVLLAMAALPALWLLLRVTPPQPRRIDFPPLKLILDLVPRQETPARTPWWLLLLRLLVAGLVIVAMAGPVWNPTKDLAGGSGPLVLLVDNGWAAAPDWTQRTEAAEDLLRGAARAGRPAAVVATADGAADVQMADSGSALEKLRALRPAPHSPDRMALLVPLQRFLSREPTAEIVWISDGVAIDDGAGFAASLKQAIGNHALTVLAGPVARPLALSNVDNTGAGMSVRVLRAAPNGRDSGVIRASDRRGLPLGEASFAFPSGAVETQATLKLPVDLRNDIARLDVADERTAGAVALVDEASRRRRVGVVSGATVDVAQPLLSPTYYVSRALSPYADVREPRMGPVEAIRTLLDEKTPMLVLADIGTLPADLRERLNQYVQQGGVLLRFAGNRLAAATGDELVPVRLRRGGRALGGALSWESPRTLAPFDALSPFSGLATPKDVGINRQLLAEPDADLTRKTWAALSDGTPIITAERRGQGLVVLVHVTADTSWSNLPLSGLFVDMLRRIVGLAGTGEAQARAAGNAGPPVFVSPLRTLDGFGVFGPPPATARPVAVGGDLTGSRDHPPGFYGSADAPLAVNTLSAAAKLAPVDFAALGARPEPLVREAPVDLRPWLVALALFGFALDTLAVLWLSGRLAFVRGGRAAAAGLVLAAALALSLADPRAALAQAPPPVQGAPAQGSPAQGAPAARPQATPRPPVSPKEADAALATRFAYVLSGDAAVDEISRSGLAGLGVYLSARTALDPAEPAGIDPARDELSLYPLIYWPIVSNRPAPGEAAIRKLDDFMKNGGTVVFDTRDALSSRPGAPQTPENRILRQILSGIAVPELEPVPKDHVITKAFYLIDNFPGRYNDGQTWIEALPREGPEADRPARAGDGVSPIIITSNDLAAAWASGRRGEPLYPLVPGAPRQREMAFRAGVNIAMYAMTGNYKADQVHVPALLERLGQ